MRCMSRWYVGPTHVGPTCQSDMQDIRHKSSMHILSNQITCLNL